MIRHGADLLIRHSRPPSVSLDKNNDDDPPRPVSPTGTFGCKDRFSPPCPPRLELPMEEALDAAVEDHQPFDSLPPMESSYDVDHDESQKLANGHSTEGTRHRLCLDEFGSSSDAFQAPALESAGSKHLPVALFRYEWNRLSAPGAGLSLPRGRSRSPGKGPRKKASSVNLTMGTRGQPRSP